MKTTALLVLAGIAAAANAQVMTMSWTVGDTGDNNGIITAGESALLTMWASMDPAPPVGYASSLFEIHGIANWDTGTISANVNRFNDAGTGNGSVGAGNVITNIQSLQFPPVFNPLYNSDNPVYIYTMTWTPADYTARTVEFTSANHLNFSVYTNNSGSNGTYTGNVLAGVFEVAPAPASLALLGLGGLVARRRR